MEATAKSSVPASAGSQAQAHAPVPPTAAQQADGAAAQTVVQYAIARREWTQADADALRANFDGLTGEQQAEVLRQLSVAINQGRLEPRTDQVPF